MKEIWHPVAEFPQHYEVSNLGRLRRSKTNGNTFAGRILRSHPMPRGYMGVTFVVNGERYPRRVHRVVAEAFHGEIPKDFVVNHIDGNPANNRSDNLEIVSQSENVRHSLDVLGVKRARGEKQHLSKLTAAKVRAIMEASKSGHSWAAIAEQFGVTKTNIGQILRGHTWRHVTGLDPAPKKDIRKLSEETARYALETYRSGKKSGRAIARELGVSQGTITDLCRGITWKHLHD